MDYLTKPVSRAQLRMFSAIFRYLFGETDCTKPFPVLYVLERLPDIFKGTTYLVLEDSKFAANIAARCIPDGNGNFVIEIRESVYNGARKNIGAYLGHICHEICHVFLFKLGYTPITERSFGSKEIPAYRSVEWQAKALCGEVLMPYAETATMTREEIIKTYHVSKSFADYRRKY